uniref:Uncharacterized protein n=1 Tax=Arundo donax TaxID=35708 RepID=A0A0A9B361_ARUDO
MAAGSSHTTHKNSRFSQRK